jgi:hypothetical protein
MHFWFDLNPARILPILRENGRKGRFCQMSFFCYRPVSAPIHEAAGARPLGCRDMRSGRALEPSQAPLRLGRSCSLKAALLPPLAPLHELALSGGRDKNSVLDKRTGRRMIRPSVVDNAQLTHKRTERCRLGIYEPDGWRSARMRLIINNLHPRGKGKARSWINDGRSHS